MKLGDVPFGKPFSFYGTREDVYVKIQNNKFIQPPSAAPSLTVLAVRLGEGKGGISHCNPDLDVVLRTFNFL